MNKTIPKKEKNQVCESKKTNFPYLTNRQIKRSRIFKEFMLVGAANPEQFALWLDKKKRHGGKTDEPGLVWQFMDYMLQMAHHGRYLCASVGYLSKKFNCHEKSIPRITGLLADMGIIKKCYRGLRRSVLLLLNPVFEQHQLLQFLSPLFPWLRKIAFSSIFVSYTFGMSPFKIMSRIGDREHVTYRYLGNLFNKRSAEAVQAQQSEGVPRTSCSGSKRSKSRETVPVVLEEQWSWGERMSRELMAVVGVPEVRRPCFGAAAPAPSPAATPDSKKRVAEQVFGCLETTVQATSDSFDNNNEGDWYMKRVPYLQDGSDWEEVYDPPVDTPQLYAEPAPQEPKVPSRAIAEQPEAQSKYSYYPRLDGFVLLRATPFGKMKLSIIPEGVLFSCYNHFLKKQQEGSSPKQQAIDYHTFFEFCVQKCKEVPIPLGPRWRRFFEACRERGIDAKKEPCVQGVRPKAYVPPEREEEDPEEGFWTCEKHTLSEQYAQAVSLIGHLPNPYRKHLEENPPTQQPKLFKLYQAAHIDGIPQPGHELEVYRKALKVFKAASSAFP